MFARAALVPGAALLFFAGSGLAADAPAPPRLERTNLLLFRAADAAVRPVKSVADWGQRRAQILADMQRVMGPLPGPENRCPLDLKIEEEEDGGGYLRRRITYQAEPGSRVPAYWLVQKQALAGGGVPGILGLHQTHPQGRKVVVGLGQSPDDEYGVELVHRGYTVLAPAYPLLADYQPDPKALGYRSGTMMAIWNNLRALDLFAATPWVKTNGYGVIGHSLGGHNGVFTAAFDERLKVVVSSCGLDSFLDYMDGRIQGWTSDRYMPRLLDYPLAEIPFDVHEIIGALAPRVCFLSAPRGDTNFKWRSVAAVAAAAAPVYRLHGAEPNLRVEHPDCGHLFPREMREKAYRLFDGQLK